MHWLNLYISKDNVYKIYTYIHTYILIRYTLAIITFSIQLVCSPLDSYIKCRQIRIRALWNLYTTQMSLKHCSLRYPHRHFVETISFC